MLEAERIKSKIQGAEQMDSETNQLEITVGSMQKRREKMADGKRYIIYYTFEKEKKELTDREFSGAHSAIENQASNEVSENV